MPRFRIDLTNDNFGRNLREALKIHPSLKDDLSKAFGILEQHPDYGDWIPGVGAEVRKMRVGVKAARIGSRGGYRLLYFVERESLLITPIILHFKPYIALARPEEVAKVVIELFEKRARESKATAEPPLDQPS